MIKLFKRPIIRLLSAVTLAVGFLCLAWPKNSQNQQTWMDLIDPLGPGELIHGDYRLSPPRRGQEQDVVFLARRVDGGAVAELHIVNRGQWSGVLETKSFGIDYEEPHSTGPREELIEVTRALASAIALNDPGGLGPVAAIPLGTSPTPSVVVQSMLSLGDLKGAVCVLCIVFGFLLIGTLPQGTLWASLLLFGVGLALRAVHLDVPFVWDQDVQRLRIAASSFGEVLTGVGINDRHPPFYFVILHVVQYFGQTETIVRLPAAFFGSLVGPALLLLTKRGSDAPRPLAVIAAVVAAFSPELIRHSREVSEIMLFALLLLGISGLTVRLFFQEKPSRLLLVGTGTSYALSLWTYYLAPLAIAGVLGMLYLQWKLSLAHSPTQRDRIRRQDQIRLKTHWILYGIVAGLPSLVLAVRIFIIDFAAREIARQHPDIAWGERGVFGMFVEFTDVLVNSLGTYSIVLCVAGLALAVYSRNTESLVCFASFFAVMLGIAFLAPFARMQPYYLVSVIPLLLLAIGSLGAGIQRRVQLVFTLLFALSSVFFLGSSPAALATQYLADQGDFMSRFAQTISRGEYRRVVTVAHYDATLLSYELAQLKGVRLQADQLKSNGGSERIPGINVEIYSLVQSHAPGHNPDSTATRQLRTLAEKGPIPIIFRNTMRLPQLERLLSRCRLMDESSRAQLRLCQPADLQDKNWVLSKGALSQDLSEDPEYFKQGLEMCESAYPLSELGTVTGSRTAGARPDVDEPSYFLRGLTRDVATASQGFLGQWCLGYRPARSLRTCS